MALDVISENARRRYVAAHSILVQHFLGPPTAFDIAVLDAAITNGIATFGRVSLISIVDWSDRSLEADTRRHTVELLKRHDATLVGVALVINAPGFSGTLARTVAAGRTWVARARAPRKVFPGLSEALQWLSTLLGQPPEFARARADLERWLRPAARRAA
jgi:hypothetical protein